MAPDCACLASHCAPPPRVWRELPLAAGVFETAEEAAALCARLVEIDKGSQVDWLADGADGDGPGARWAQDLTFESEPCQFYRKEPRGTEGEDEGEAARPQLEA